MAIDFTLPPELGETRRQVREFIDEVIKPALKAPKSCYGPWGLDCRAPDEGNMHTLLPWQRLTKPRSISVLCVRSASGRALP